MVVYTLRKNLLGCSFFFLACVTREIREGISLLFCGCVHIYMCSVNNVTHIALDMTL